MDEYGEIDEEKWLICKRCGWDFPKSSRYPAKRPRLCADCHERSIEDDRDNYY